MIKKKQKKLLKFLGATALGVGTGVVLCMAWKKMSTKYTFLEEQGANVEDILPALEMFLDFDKGEPEEIIRIAEAKVQLKRKERYSVDFSGLLVFSALEKHLRKIAKAKDVCIEGESSKGLIPLAKKLRSCHYLSSEVFKKIKKLTKEVRNPLIHGGAYDPTAVEEALVFTEQLLLTTMSSDN